VAGLPGRPEVVAVVLLPGGLTNSNFRLEFRDGGPSVEAKLYQHERNLAPVERAVHRLGAARNLPMPKLFDGADDNAVTGTPYALFEWLGGERLDLAIRTCDAPSVTVLARKVGIALAAVHAVHFDSFGFFDADLKVQGQIDLGSAGMRRYFHDVLTQGLGRERLGPHCADALLAFAEREVGILDTWHGPPCLTHGDCGGTNILVSHKESEPLIAGIIDWEFAFSGTPFFDLGNICRAPLGGLPGFADGLAAGYRAAGGFLPDQWRALAAMTDLLAWVESAVRPRASAEFLQSAQRAISETIAGWKATSSSA
jgi:aminoglycoside phosphotransferase (APT) family kinase protein